MSIRATFHYFQGMECDMYSFYRIPKLLFTSEYFKNLSCEAKVLYGLMLDRMSLSIKNRWFDEEDRAYIFFSVEEIMEMLNCGRNKAVNCLKELDQEKGIGLIEKRRIGLGKTNVIYVKNMLLDGEDFEDPTKNILFLLSSMIGNPVALYYSNLTCCASTTQDLSDFVFEKNVEKYKPDIVTRFEYKKQRKEHTQYITKIHVLGRTEIYLVVTEVNMPLTILDYMALENAVITLQYSFMETYAKNEIEKKYQRDIEYSLLNGLLTGDELSKAARMLKLKDTAQYCVVSFHTISSNSEDYYTKEELEEIGVIEGEIQRLLPDEHIYRNRNQIVCIHEIKPGETQAGFREEMEKLYDTIQKQIIHRKKTTDFQIGIGSIVEGYRDLKKSFQDSKKIIDYMDMIRYLYSDKNISVGDFSKLGFFQIFEKVKTRDELMVYVPESLVKLYQYDSEHDGELIETLQAYLDCDKSANKAAEKLYVNYRTLSGRLKKIKDISGIDFKNSAEMLAVRNGIVLFKMAETL